MEKLLLDEMMKMNKSSDLEGIGNSMRIMAKYAPIELINDDKYNLFYECKLDDVLKSDVDEETMIQMVTQCGWEYSDDKTKLIRRI